jgi:5-formyltetrahydrofolate cyclo-ligase
MKSRIRKDVIRIRDGMDDSEIDKRSRAIESRLISTGEFRESKTVLFYVSTKSEVRTKSMINHALGLGKMVAVPLTDVNSRDIRPFEIKDFEKDLAEGSFGLMEPRRESCNEVGIDDVDLIIVPGTAFDRKGNRIGYGKGFYDKLLSKCRDAFTIGLAYDFQLVERIPEESHDVRVKMIITDKRILKI